MYLSIEVYSCSRSQVGWHPKFKDSRCFHIVRVDGTVEDFSYRKCILGALEIVDPKMSKIQKKKWSGRDDKNVKDPESKALKAM